MMLHIQMEKEIIGVTKQIEKLMLDSILKILLQKTWQNNMDIKMLLLW
jgi:hypothetical protein